MRKLLKPYKDINRIIDANINRTKEGLRVCEEIARFVISSRKLTLELKQVRHQLTETSKILVERKALLLGREALRDVGKGIKADELKRSNIGDIFFANVQRVKESLRVLEEFSKLINLSASVRFKALRYKVYQIEKDFPSTKLK